MEIDGLNAGKLAAMDLDLSRDANDENAHALCPGEREPVLTSSAAALAGLSAGSDRYRVLAAGKVALEVNVIFAFDSAVISSAFDSEIGVAATALRDNSDLRATVVGHTDSIGDDNYNQQLSERRAMAVRDLLVNQHGVAASQVTAVGRGETMPIASNKSAEGRNANRRVDLVLDIVK